MAIFMHMKRYKAQCTEQECMRSCQLHLILQLSSAVLARMYRHIRAAQMRLCCQMCVCTSGEDIRPRGLSTAYVGDMLCMLRRGSVHRDVAGYRKVMPGSLQVSGYCLPVEPDVEVSSELHSLLLTCVESLRSLSSHSTSSAIAVARQINQAFRTFGAEFVSP